MVMKRALPVVISYFFISMAFGVAASKLLGMYSVLMSLTVFAGAAQFIAIRMFQENYGAITVILTVLLVNSRHLLMSGYISSTYPDIGRLKKALMAFGITDETFALGISSDCRNHSSQIKLNLMAFSAWVSGTLTGVLFGEAVPEGFYQIMPFGLTAMFISILVSGVDGYPHIAAAAVAGIVSVALGSGTAIVIASIAGIFAGSVMEKWTGKQ